MRRTGHLFDRLVSFENLLLAAKKARAGKRAKPAVAAFEYALEPELLALSDELARGTWRPGAYRLFRVHDPKTREIAAAPYRDRVVHHALLNIIEPIFERSFTRDSFSCRKGLGTHRALDRFTALARRHAWVLKADVARYFPSVDHEILAGLLARKLKDRRILDVLSLVIESFVDPAGRRSYFPGDTLFTPLERRVGIPIGNLTSQFFANVYLDPLDHFVREVLHVPGYIRYTDDLVVFGDDPATLRRHRAAIDEFLARRLRLRLHARKTQVFPVAQGTHFLGWRAFPRHRLLLPTSVSRARRRLASLARAFRSGRIDRAGVDASVQSWLGHVGHGDTYHLRGALLSRIRFTREDGSKRHRSGCAGGGSWNNDTNNLRCANRNHNDPTNRNNNVGFRCASSPLCRTKGPVSMDPGRWRPELKTRLDSRCSRVDPGAEQNVKGPLAS